MELRTALHDRRSIRRYTDRAVERALLETLLKQALWAPSGMNRQPWKFVVMQGAALKRLLAFSESMVDDMEAPLVAQGFNEKMRAMVKGYFRNLGGASAAVVFLSKKETEYLADHANLVSVAAAMYNFLLLAHEAGLATCWMTGYSLHEDRLMDLIGVEGYELVGVTPVGYPDQTPPIPPRKHEDIVWME
jgi:nitroreductase